MKKTLLGLLSCVMLCGVVFAQKTDPALQGNLETAQDVISAMQASQFLPLHLNEFDSFNGENEKQLALKFALKQVKKYDNYLTNYNVAVIYAAAASEEGVDYGVRVNDQEAKQAIKYATLAIGKDAKAKNTPYMYLLRGQVRFEHAVGYDIAEGKFSVSNKPMAADALKDFEKVAELNPALAPYGIMGVLAEVLGNKDKAAQYQLFQKRQDKKASEAATQAVKEAFKKK